MYEENVRFYNASYAHVNDRRILYAFAHTYTRARARVKVN